MFHNGEPVTAEDVKFSFERYRGAAHELMKKRVAAVETPDPRHVRFKLKEPWPDFLTFYTSASGAGWIVPKKYVEKVGDDGFKKAPIGAGPYKFVSFTPGVELVLEAFDQYWRKTPSVKRLVMKVIPDESDAAGGVEARRDRHRLFDPRRTRRGVAAHARAHAEAGGRRRRPFWLYFPEQWDPKSPWHDERVRQAASLGDRSQGHQRGIDNGLFADHRQPIPGKFRVLLAAAGPGLRSGEGASSCWPRRVFPTASMPAIIYCDFLLRQYRRGGGQQPRAVGIRASCGRSSGPPSVKGYTDKTYKNIIQAGAGAFGNVATRRKRSWSRAAPSPTAAIPTSTRCSRSRRSSWTMQNARRS